MTQDSPNQPNPENPRNSRPQETPSFLKLQIIKVLRGTIAVLEGTLEKLETDPSAPLLPPLPNSWRRVLRPIRTFLPASINRKISDWGLTGAIAGLLVIMVWTATNYLSPAEPIEQVAELPPPETTEIVENPPSEPEAETPEDITEIPDLEIPGMTETPPEETNLPPLAPSLEEPEEFEESQDSLPEETEAEEILESAAESEAESEAESDSVQLSPEELLIASIQDKVMEVTRQYTQGIVQTIQANFRGDVLLVKVSNRWYELSDSQQNKLANQMLEKSQSLDFSTLEIIDKEENLVARSPVVGSQMIILRRSLIGLS
jgi:hypothetical protein